MSLIPGFNEPFPTRDPIVKESRHPADVLVRWEEQSLQLRVDATPFRVQQADVLTGIIATGSGTLGGDQAAGLYRVTAYREVTAADPVSQSLALTLRWTHNTKPMTRILSAFTGAPMNTNDNTGDVAAIEIDPGTPISYDYTYASNTPGVGQFALTISAELLQAIA